MILVSIKNFSNHLNRFPQKQGHEKKKRCLAWLQVCLFSLFQALFQMILIIAILHQIRFKNWLPTMSIFIFSAISQICSSPSQSQYFLFLESFKDAQQMKQAYQRQICWGWDSISLVLLFARQNITQVSPTVKISVLSELEAQTFPAFLPCCICRSSQITSIYKSNIQKRQTRASLCIVTNTVF